jgi:hypothetical protein
VCKLEHREKDVLFPRLEFIDPEMCLRPRERSVARIMFEMSNDFDLSHAFIREGFDETAFFDFDRSL